MSRAELTEGSAKRRIRETLLAAWNHGDLDGLDELLADDYERRTFRSGAGYGIDELKQSITDLRAAFPDLLMTVGEMTQEGDRVVWEWHVRGTHDAPLFGLPPTHRVVEVSGLTASTFRGDRIAREWVTSDPDDMLSLQGIVQLDRASLAVESALGTAARGPDPDALKAVHRTFGTGVTIVSASVAGEPRGLVLNAFASVSLEPPLVLVAVNRSTATHEFLFGGDAFAINILAADQVELARRFSQPIPDKFEGVAWHPGENSAPVLEGASAYVEAQVQERMTVATHTVFLGRVSAARVSDKAPLIYLRGRFHDASSLVDAEDPDAGTGR